MSKEQKDKSPAFRWYPKDAISSARLSLLSLAEEGAYRRAIDFCWLNGSIPADPKKLAFLIGKGCTEKIARGILGMFLINPANPETLIHDRVEQERQKQKEFSEKQSGNGSKGGRPRKENPEESQPKPKPFPNDNPNRKPKKALQFAVSVNDKKENNPLTPRGGIELPFGNDFKEAWERWKVYKQQQHKFKYKSEDTERSSTKLLTDLSGNDEAAAVAIIEQSIANGWKGFVELKEKPKGQVATAGGGNILKTKSVYDR